MTSKRFNTTNVILLSSTIVILAYLRRTPWFPIKRDTKANLGYPRDSLLNFTELTSEYGYISEEHKVVTEDGYILTIFRIVKSRNCNGKIKSPPVFLMHGLLQSSDSWIDSGPSSGLAYLISDACYDLWVGNNRGNYYSRQHVRLNPDRDTEYWNFYSHEIGFYDIPAMIDYVLDYTATEKLNYIGFSQGTGTFLVMCSERPEYCDKVQLLIGLAPAARQINTKSKIFRGVTQALEKLESVLTSYDIQEVLSKGDFCQEFMAFYCQLSEFTRNTCVKFLEFLDYVDSFHSESIDSVTGKVLFGHFPAGTSVHNMARYGQSMRSSNFQKYDYGKERNLIVYGSEEPSKYNLSAVTVPVVCIYGKNDGLVDTKDVKWLVSKLPKVIESVEVQNPLWNHMDMTYSQHTSEIIFPKINEYLFMYSKD